MTVPSLGITLDAELDPYFADLDEEEILWEIKQRVGSFLREIQIIETWEIQRD